MQNSPAQSQRATRVAWLAGLLALLLASDSRACGFHNDVSIARGALNWVYPDALHVVGAISTAVMQKQLQLRDDEPVAPGLFGAQYRATAKSLERLAASLDAATGAASLSFSLVLIEPMLWTRFEAIQGGINTQLHVSGPQPGDLIVVSGQDVIRAVAEGDLAVGEAHGRGLIRLYGSEVQVATFLGAFRSVGRDRLGALDQTHAPTGPRSAVMQ